VLVAAAREERRRGHRITDPAVVDQLARGLEGARHERRRRAADEHARVAGGGDDAVRILERRGEWLLGEDVLAGRDGRERHVGVDGRRREVDDDLDVAILQELVEAQDPWDAMRRGLPLGQLTVEIGAREGLDLPEGRAALEVLAADVAAADEAEPDGVVLCHSGGPTRSGPARRRRRTAARADVRTCS
jgi:hypothetical protein